MKSIWGAVIFFVVFGLSLISALIFLHVPSQMQRDSAIAALESEIQFLAILGGVSPVLVVFGEHYRRVEQKAAIKFSAVYIIAIMACSALGFFLALQGIVSVDTPSFNSYLIYIPIMLAFTAMGLLVGYLLFATEVILP
jgi:hypothetical protein